jgi:ligand-binding sensor domain-containing protein
VGGHQRRRPHHFDPRTGTFIRYGHQPGNPNSPSGDRVFCLAGDGAGNLWIGTGDGRLTILSKDRKTFRRYPAREAEPAGLAAHSIYSFCRDRAGNVWVGTDSKGVSYYSPYLHQFRHYRHVPGDPASLSHNAAFSFAEDPQGQPLDRHRRGRPQPVRPAAEPLPPLPRRLPPPGGLTSDNVVSVYVDRGGQLWLGTWGGGLLAWDPRKESFRRYRKEANNPAGLASDLVWTVYEDRRRNLWVGTTFGGLHRLDPGRDASARSSRPPRTRFDQFQLLSCRSKKIRGYAVVGTAAGLNARPPREPFYPYRHTPGTPGSQQQLHQLLLLRSAGNLWIHSKAASSAIRPGSAGIQTP